MNTGLVRHKKGELVYYTAKSLDELGFLRHCFTTRLGGVSEGELSGLNMGMRRGDKTENLMKNYDIICSAIGTVKEHAVASKQTHGKTILRICRQDCGKGILFNSDITDADGLICNESSVMGVVYTADCVPVIIADPENKAYAVVHSGWRSTAKNICREAIEKMVQCFNSRAENLVCVAGPSIGQCHFEVDGDVAEFFKKENTIARGKKFYVDLWKEIYGQLTQTGVSDENITIAEMCTVCRSDEFFSNRVQKGKMGHMAAMAEII